VGDPRTTYYQRSIKRWREELKWELHVSGLPDAISRLTNDMARVNALLSKADTVIRLLQEMTVVYQCVLLRYGLLSFD
jgi:hypothetical protein